MERGQRCLEFKQGVQDRKQRWGCGELLPVLGLNSVQWGQNSGPSIAGTQARVADRLIDDGCGHACSTPSSGKRLTCEGGAALMGGGSRPHTIWDSSSHCPIMQAVFPLCPQSGQRLADITSLLFSLSPCLTSLFAPFPPFPSFLR